MHFEWIFIKKTRADNLWYTAAITKKWNFTYYGTTVDSRYLDFGYLEQPLISKKKSGPCLNIEI